MHPRSPNHIMISTCLRQLKHVHTQVDFTYPGTTRQILKEVTIQCSLNSRIAILGPNGAGKSTMVKLLTGELLPDSGVCWKHPNMRVAYVAQHAFHHIENHLDMVRTSLPPCLPFCAQIHAPESMHKNPCGTARGLHHAWSVPAGFFG